MKHLLHIGRVLLIALTLVVCVASNGARSHWNAGYINESNTNNTNNTNNGNANGNGNGNGNTNNGNGNNNNVTDPLEFWGDVTDHLYDCGLITEGFLAFDGPPPGSVEWDMFVCTIECAMDSGCVILEQAICFDIEDGIEACSRACEPEPFRCNSGEPISPEWVCDGEWDCVDGEDEMDCAVSDYVFVCDDGQSIALSWRCDGERHCNDSSDERGCADFTCGSWGGGGGSGGSGGSGGGNQPPDPDDPPSPSP